MQRQVWPQQVWVGSLESFISFEFCRGKFVRRKLGGGKLGIDKACTRACSIPSTKSFAHF